MANLREEIRAVFDEQPIPPGLPQRVLSEVHASENAVRRTRYTWIASAVATVLVVATLLTIRGHLAASQHQPAESPTPPMVQSPTPTPTPTATVGAAPLWPVLDCVVIQPASPGITATYRAYLGYD